MTKIKLCGLRRSCDAEYANEVCPEFVGFVFIKSSRRYVTPEQAAELRRRLDGRIIPIGVFADEDMEVIAELLRRHIIEGVQLHGAEDEAYISALRRLVKGTVIKAFCVKSEADIAAANRCSADYVLLDAGGGLGKTFEWSLLKGIRRPYFLAGGLTPENVKTALESFHPFCVDASSSLETDGWKDKEKMAAFVAAVRGR